MDEELSPSAAPPPHILSRLRTEEASWTVLNRGQSCRSPGQLLCSVGCMQGSVSVRCLMRALGTRWQPAQRQPRHQLLASGIGQRPPAGLRLAHSARMSPAEAMAAPVNGLPQIISATSFSALRPLLQ